MSKRHLLCCIVLAVCCGFEIEMATAQPQLPDQDNTLSTGKCPPPVGVQSPPILSAPAPVLFQSAAESRVVQSAEPVPIQPLAGQCITGGGCTNFSSNYPAGTWSTTSETWTTVSTVIYGGDYAYYAVTAGKTYEWSLCSSDGGYAPYDSQLTLWDQSGTTPYCYSDDYCGDDASISWTATFTGTVRVLVSQYSCATNATNSTLLWRCLSGAARPDLTPYQPSAWNDKIPIGITQLAGTAAHSYTGPYYDNQTLYFNCSSLNQGSASAASHKIRLEVTGTGGASWDLTGVTLDAGYYIYLTNDLAVGPLSAGTHTFKIWVDYDGVVAESNENNNYYERTITVAPGSGSPDLTPYQPSAWNDKIPIGNTQLAGTADHTYSGPYYDNQTLYFNCASLNQGTVTAASHRIHLEVTGTGGGSWDLTGVTLDAGYYIHLTNDLAVGPLSAGTHTFKIWVDYDGVVAESNENNNYYERTITVTAPTPMPDLTPYQLGAWNDKIPIGNTQLAGSASHTYSGPYFSNQTLYFNWSSLNQGTASATAHKVHVEVTGTGGASWDWTGLTLDPTYYLYLTNDLAVGPLSAGTHTFKVWADYDGVIAESNESNNYYERTITVSPPPTAEIHGVKWHDLDGDGSKDAGEPGLQNWKIYLDANNNCAWDSGEPFQMTGADGSYAFTALANGNHVVAEVQQSCWTQTYPTPPAGEALQGGPTTFGDQLTPEQARGIRRMVMNSPPTPPPGAHRSVASSFSASAVLLHEVPTSTWTYGCSATSAGMMFGYYDRNGYPNMYTGPANGGLAPLTDLGQGIDSTPIAGACSIIATQNGFDGRTTRGHVDDYWIEYNAGGPDPWEGNWTEHTWADCTADYMGTNQWKWDFDTNGAKDANVDGATTFFWNGTSRLYDFVPPAEYGAPQTELCHGMRLFAESRGYTVIENYTQAIGTGGFTFADYMAEIDAGRPVMIQVEGHSMVGVGYEASTQTVYLHDTWDNAVHTMTWGGAYAGMQQIAVTVIHLAPATPCIVGRHTLTLAAGQVVSNINFGNRSACLPPTNCQAAPSAFCLGQQANATLSATAGDGGNTVDWFTGSCGGTPVAGGASPVVSPTTTTTYYARTRNSASGCVSSTCCQVELLVATPGDFDCDGDVDGSDLEIFSQCRTGPAIKYQGALPAGCTLTPNGGGKIPADFDQDVDVDQADFGVFQKCYSGENTPPDPNCAG